MGRYTQETGSAFEHAPVGTHVARCYSIVDIGTQHSSHLGKPTTRNQIVVFFELAETLMEDGKPFIVTKFYTNSLNEKSNLYGDLIAWRGKEFTDDELKRFDLEKILGATCLLTIVHNDKGRAVIAAIMGLPKNMQCPPPVNEKFTFWLDAFDQDKFEKLSNGMKNLVMQSDEYKNLGNVKSDFDDEVVPF